MKVWVVDTSAYSWGLRGQPEIAHLLSTADVLILPPIVIGELLAGFKKGGREKRNRSLLSQFLNSPRVETPGLTEDTAERYATILDGLQTVGSPIPTNDVWIAATAMEAGSPLLTTDAHFERIPQILVHVVKVT